MLFFRQNYTALNRPRKEKVMPIAVNELRLSLVWNKVFAKDVNLPSLADPATYRDAFQSAAKQSGGWLLPWIPGNPQHFWQYYLKPVAPSNFETVSPDDARSYLVPLRVAPFCEVKAQDGTAATFEGFCFPHSVSVVATIRLRPDGPLPLGDMVTATVTARNADFNITWKDSKVQATHGSLQSLADKTISFLHTLVGIDNSALGVPLPPPISIATIIDAEGEDDDKLLDQSLKGLCLLRPGWKTAQLEFESTGAAEVPNNKLGAIAKGRSVWLPDRFSATEVKGRKTALGCYHRNLTIASLQTAGLAALVGRADDILADPKSHLLSISPREVSQAVNIMGTLERGEYCTYRSWSMKHQTSFYKDRIKRVSDKLCR
jgi:hypothetical protein